MTPQIEILTCDISARDAGVMLVALNRVGATRGVILALDRFGRVVWCKEVPFGIVDFRQSLRGTLLIVADDGHALEMGLNGHVLRQWFGADRFPEGAFGVQLAVETLHGSIEEIAPDIYLSMSVRRHSDGTSDTVLVFDRKGAVHWEWDLRELVGLDHCTCALMDPTDGGILLALRDLDGVVKISRRGALEWVLGDDMPAALARKALAVEGGCVLRDPRDLSFAANGALTMFCDGAAVGYRIEGRSAGEAWRFEVDSKSGGVVETPNRNRFVTTNRAFHEVSPSGGIAFHGRLAGGWTAVRTEYLDAEMAVKLC